MCRRAGGQRRKHRSSLAASRLASNANARGVVGSTGGVREDAVAATNARCARSGKLSRGRGDARMNAGSRATPAARLRVVETGKRRGVRAMGSIVSCTGTALAAGVPRADRCRPIRRPCLAPMDQQERRLVAVDETRSVVHRRARAEHGLQVGADVEVVRTGQSRSRRQDRRLQADVLQVTRIGPSQRSDLRAADAPRRNNRAGSPPKRIASRVPMRPRRRRPR